MATALDRATLRTIAERALDEWDICAVELEMISISENTVFRLDTDAAKSMSFAFTDRAIILSRTELRAAVDSRAETSGRRCAITTIDPRGAWLCDGSCARIDGDPTRWNRRMV